MHREKLQDLLKKVQSKRCSIEDALVTLSQLPFSDLDVAKVDHHRALRCGFAEVVFGAGKSSADIIRILENGLGHVPCMLTTRVDERQAAAISARFSDAVYNPRGRTVRVGKPVALETRGYISVVTAGTSDIPVA